MRRRSRLKSTESDGQSDFIDPFSDTRKAPETMDEELVRSELNRIYALSTSARLESDELASCAWTALYEAKARFNPRLGTSFYGFARQRIRGAIYNGLAALTPLGRRGARATKRLLNAREASLLTRSSSKDDQNEGQLSFVEGYQRLQEYALSLWMDQLLTVEVDPSITHLETTALQQTRALVGTAFEQLDPEDQRLLIAVYDLRRVGDSASQLAKREGVNRSTISRRSLAAIIRLRTLIKQTSEQPSQRLRSGLIGEE